MYRSTATPATRTDETTFGSMTLEELVNAGLLPAASRLRDRYLPR
jgi:hypothetical protein